MLREAEEITARRDSSEEDEDWDFFFAFFVPSRFAFWIGGVFAVCFGVGADAAVGWGVVAEKAAMPGYGVEVYRIVSGPDEIVSVLRNGAVVICKRVASPVAAVRGYAETGGVYEGQWLGGGLSHICWSIWWRGGAVSGGRRRRIRSCCRRLGTIRTRIRLTITRRFL